MMSYSILKVENHIFNNITTIKSGSNIVKSNILKYRSKISYYLKKYCY